jgi:PEP-CTERM motif
MSTVPYKSSCCWLVLAAAATALQAPSLSAQVVAPSTYTTAITVQTEPLGTEFADWAASGIPVVDMDPADNVGSVDLANLQIANDANYLYLHTTMHSDPASLGNLYLAFDTDQNIATGFDVFGLGLVGSDFAYQTDFPFQQAAGVFNTGAAVTGEIALIFPFWTEAGAPFGNEIEWRIPLDVMVAGSPAFPNDSFDMMVYSTEGFSDVSQVIRYTLAEAPAGDPGDFDGDEDVDGADFIEWQLGVGTEFDADDLADWRANFGTQPPPVAAIPEPAAIALLAIGLFGVAARRRS